jgi:hypothetical protein
MPLPKLAWDFNGTTTEYMINRAISLRSGWTPTYGTGKYNRSLIFTNQAGVTPPVTDFSCTFPWSVNISQGFTVAFWVKINVVNSTYIIHMGNTGTGWGININDSGSHYINENGTYPYNSQNYNFVIGQWCHVLLSIGSAVSWYKNGAILGSPIPYVASTASVLQNRFWIGSDEYYGFNGEIDDLRIFDRALTAAQVQSIYNQQGVPGRGAVQATPTYNAPLTGASNLNRVYGLQRLTTAYNGNIINIRRSSDNTNVNFTVDYTNTSLVTASDGQTLSSWLGAGTANVVIWYDQSGNGKNLTQLTNGNQPGFSATTGLLYSTGLFMNFPDNMTITDVSFLVGYIQRGYYGPGSSSQWYTQDLIVAGERAGVTNDYGLVIGGSGLFGLGTGSTDGAASTIATNGTGVYSFMTCTRNSTTGQVLLYNGEGSGTSFTKNTGTLSGITPTTMGKNPYASSGFINADVSSFFMFDSVKSQPEIASIASRFVNSTFTASPVRLTGTPLFTQLSQAATSSAVGAFSLRAVNGTTARAVNVAPGGAFPVTPFTRTSSASTTYTQFLTRGILSGQYTATASSVAFGCNPGWGFIGNATSPPLWQVNTYPASGGTVSTPTTTTTGGTNYNGDWVQLQLPYQIVMTSYSLKTIITGTFVLLGSTTGATSSWTLIDTQNPNGDSTITKTGLSISAYNYLRFVIISSVTTSYPGLYNIQFNGTVPSLAQDFYADRLGNLLTAPVTGQSLANWLGGATGYVTTWYDQSGRGNHMNQPTAANQPILSLATTPASLVLSGTEYLQNTVPFTFNFGSGSFTLRYVVSNNTGGLVVYKANGNDFVWSGNEKKFWLGNGTTNEASRGGFPSQVGHSEDYIYTASAIGSTKTSVVHKATSTTGIPIYVNGTLQTLGRNTLTMGTDPGNFLYFGRGGQAINYIGNLHEIEIFSTALSDTDRTLVEALPI